MGAKISVRVLTLGMVVTLLGGCETMNETYASIKDTFASINFPKLEPRQHEATTQDEREINTATTSENNGPILAGDLTEEEKMAEPAQIQSFAYDETSSSSCPEIAVVEELNSLYQFKNPQQPTPRDKVSDIRFTTIDSYCQEDGDNLVVNLKLTVEGQLGTKGRNFDNERPSFSYPYFIAVTTGNGNILGKDIKALTVNYGTHETYVTRTESIQHIMPLAHNSDDPRSSILIGFQLNPAQLAYNRAVQNTSAPQTQTEESVSDIEPVAGDAPLPLTPIDITAQ